MDFWGLGAAAGIKSTDDPNTGKEMDSVFNTNHLLTSCWCNIGEHKTTERRTNFCSFQTIEKH